ncbi:MAG: hydroxymethylbilane synthase [Actinomycetota bacterium]|jgi:hydroxymethylbilane synthase
MSHFALRIATRSSAQARTQAEVIAAALEAANPGCHTELVFIDTLGDQRQDVPLHTIGGQGVFVKEVQRAVFDGHADIAVHSAKDLPSQPAVSETGATLIIGAFTERRDARDALVGSTIDGLRLGATVATGSVRRRAQLYAIRPDLHFVELRGNISTRLSKVPDDGAIVMAVAALEILGLTDRIAQIMDADTMVPAVGQGCVAVECRSDDAGAIAALATIDHAPSRRAVSTERAFLAELGSGCSLPIGAHVRDGHLTAFLANDNRRSLQSTVRLGHDWSATAIETARSMHAEIQR